MRFGGLIAAIVFAAIAAVIVLRMMGNQQAPAPVAAPVASTEVKTVSIYVAAQPIPIGSTITQEMLAVQPWPEHLVLDGFTRADKGAATVIGMVARSPFQTQEPIIISKLANRNDPNFLAGELPKGMRVITIQTNEVEGLAGFVFPGDRVDVILTHEVTPPVDEESKRAPEKVSITETILTNVKVLAVDQRAMGANATDAQGKLLIPHSISLMVSPADAQRLRLAQKMGTVTLSLRSIEDKDVVDPLTITHASDISQFKGDGPSTAPGEGGGSVLVRRGAPKEGKESQDEMGNAITGGAAPRTGFPIPAGAASNAVGRGF